ncbi:MAG: LLM class F420-dependent oxidoreductase [Acidimicrobiia bacterium]
MKIGIMFANGARGAEPEHAAVLARDAERLGFESLWAVQHVVMPIGHASSYPYSDSGTVPGGTAVAIPDPLVWLAWAGALTSSITLATGVLVLPQQHPLVVAKQVATLDRLTGGRVVLGLGAGWLREEFDALGAEFDGRGSRMDEAIEAMRRAWMPGPAEFHGEQISFGPVDVEPKPIRSVPIVIGGHSPAAARRAGRLADGFFPLACQGDRLVELVTAVRRAALDAGRDPAAIEVTVDAPKNQADAEVHMDLGVTRVVVNAPHVSTGDLSSGLEQRLSLVRERFANT